MIDLNLIECSNKMLLKTHSQIKWDMRLQNLKKIQINIFWAPLYHIDRETSFQDTKLTPKIFLEFNDFFHAKKRPIFGQNHVFALKFMCK